MTRNEERRTKRYDAKRGQDVKQKPFFYTSLHGGLLGGHVRGVHEEGGVAEWEKNQYSWIVSHFIQHISKLTL